MGEFILLGIWLWWIIAATSAFFGKRRFPPTLYRRNWRPW